MQLAEQIRAFVRPMAPNAITCVGHALTLAWLLGAPVWIGVIGLLCDDLDGWVARKLGATSIFGSTYDWTVDVTVAAVVFDHLGLLPLALVAVPLQVRARLAGRRVGGRAALSVLLAVVTLAQPAARTTTPGGAAGGADNVTVIVQPQGRPTGG